MDYSLEAPREGRFEVNFIRDHIVKALNNPLSQRPYHVLNLSNLDLLCGRFPVTYFYFYRDSMNEKIDLIKNFKRSLALTLERYYPFAGRIVQNRDTGEPMIICDNSGALIVEADANIPLKALDFYDLDKFVKWKLVSIRSEFATQIQITRYICKSISITFSFDHALGDASAFGKFMLSWSEAAQEKPISCTPNHHRDTISPRIPIRYHPSLDQRYVKCTLEDIKNIPIPKILIKRLYFIDAISIDRLHKLASNDSNHKRTKIEAFSAHVWKIMVKAVDREKHKTCKMGWLVDGRSRMSANNEKSMSSYIGNVLSLAFGEARLDELENASIHDVANMAHVAISEAANGAHFADLVDWVECHRPGMMMSRAVLGRGGPTVVLSSGRRFPVSELDFGFGSPILGTVCSTVEKIGVAYLNQRPSANNSGAWVISAILWPEFAAALESDPVFQPMTASHLGLV